MLKISFPLAIILLATAMISCQKNENIATVSIEVPGSHIYSDRKSDAEKYIATTSVQAPATVASFNCLILNVTGVGEYKSGSGFGIVSSTITVSNGGSLSTKVPYGENILFQILGLVSTVGCPNSVTAADLLSTTKFPAVVEVGRAIASISGDTSIEIDSTYATAYSAGKVFDWRSGNALATTIPPQIGDPPNRPTGTLGTFVQTTPTMPVAHEHSSAIQIGSKIYLIGGSLGATYDGLSSGTTTGILESTIDSTGYPGAFTKSTFSLSVPRKGARAEVIGNYVYIFGGYSGSGQTTSTPLNTIERATHDGTNLTSNFTVVSQTLAQGRYNFLTLVTPGYVYAIGGGTSAGYDSNTIEQATVDKTTGEISSFTALTRSVVNSTTVTNGLVDNRWTHNGIRLGSNFYILGGEGISTIEKVVVNTDGTLGNFVKLSNTLTTARNRLSIVALANKAYVFGGWSGSFLTTVESADITNNELGVFSIASGIMLSAGVENGTSLLTSQGVYLFGGSSGATQNYIQRAPITP